MFPFLPPHTQEEEEEQEEVKDTACKEEVSHCCSVPRHCFPILCGPKGRDITALWRTYDLSICVDRDSAELHLSGPQASLTTCVCVTLMAGLSSGSTPLQHPRNLVLTIHPRRNMQQEGMQEKEKVKEEGNKKQVGKTPSSASAQHKATPSREPCGPRRGKGYPSSRHSRPYDSRGRYLGYY